jgi:hypothetical protein
LNFVGAVAELEGKFIGKRNAPICMADSELWDRGETAKGFDKRRLRRFLID